jgi:hypothetical protein
MPQFDWETDERLLLPRSSLMACAYNAAVNYGSDRAAKKMRDLVRAINHYERAEGVVKLDYLVSKGVIDSYTACLAECEMRPGGLFHAPGCENDSNHPISRARRERAREMLPERQTYAANVSLVGSWEAS